MDIVWLPLVQISEVISIGPQDEDFHFSVVQKYLFQKQIEITFLYSLVVLSSAHGLH